MSWLCLENKTVVVTGAAGGIGLAITHSFLEEGARVVMIDQYVDQLESAAAELSDGVSFEVCDMSQTAQIQSVASKIEKLHKVNVLVNAAAVLRPGTLEACSEEDWNKMLAVNLTGYLTASKCFARGMLERESGALIHIASIAGNNPQPASIAYSASKAATLMMSRQLAQEWGDRGVRSNCISPGLILTPMTEAFYQKENVKQQREKIIPLGRIGLPEDIASAVLFLASDRASYVTGADLVVDGGVTQTFMGLLPRPGYEKDDQK